ncbi:TRAP transporter small permease [Pseudofulvimonas gallinarii]|jgi:TRAP-type C4-dicarboxylate transport system permease small subunit|uniref:TRAP transporter small permease protein n=1 Tax=Pseudofulvimonas gallinarii TaxID=634155 RepID=A0A4S3L002_9GAMM|nr:TRAP transporter small permease subunit [Pseudofulvimonas gallinarii]TCT01181.1 TRAP-type C4-dicarboxylate transport system permease small subunit [Pseudofulvimonas gallinarii]THD14950.1 hypothetical protein B1808_00655 [Pseudofulvimonas gallinarii]
MSVARKNAWAGALHRLEDGVLALAVFALVLLATASIVLRTGFDTGLPWLDPLLRMLVLWLAMLGAMAAAREGRHIGLDIAARWLPALAARVVRMLTYGFAAAISAILAWQALRMVRDEYEIGGIAFASVPSWLAQAILPFGLAVIALRLAAAAFRAPTPPADGIPGH